MIDSPGEGLFPKGNQSYWPDKQAQPPHPWHQPPAPTPMSLAPVSQLEKSVLHSCIPHKKKRGILGRDEQPECLVEDVEGHGGKCVCAPFPTGTENMKAGHHTEAFSYFQRAADRGYSKAQYNVGLCLEHGRGTPRDLGKVLSHPQTQ